MPAVPTRVALEEAAPPTGAGEAELRGASRPRIGRSATGRPAPAGKGRIEAVADRFAGSEDQEMFPAVRAQVAQEGDGQAEVLHAAARHGDDELLVGGPRPLDPSSCGGGGGGKVPEEAVEGGGRRRPARAAASSTAQAADPRGRSTSALA